MQTFTQHEKDFVVEFLADILHGLTINNVLSRQDYDGFVRMQDALEVLDNLKMLYSKHTEDEGDWTAGETVAKWTFTLDDARDALTNYDTGVTVSGNGFSAAQTETYLQLQPVGGVKETVLSYTTRWLQNCYQEISAHKIKFLFRCTFALWLSWSCFSDRNVRECQCVEVVRHTG